MWPQLVRLFHKHGPQFVRYLGIGPQLTNTDLLIFMGTQRGGQDGAFVLPKKKKLIERLITRFAMEQLRRLQFLFVND
jgi:hypothetical protein